MQYVIIGFGYKEVIEAPNAVEAFAAAQDIAKRERLDTWLLYDRALNLIADVSRIADDTQTAGDSTHGNTGNDG